MRFLAIHNAALLYAIDSTGDNLAKTHTTECHLQTDTLAFLMIN